MRKQPITRSSRFILRIMQRLRTLKAVLSNGARGVLSKVDTYPFQIFIGFLMLLFLLIVIGNTLRKPKDTKGNNMVSPKHVSIYSIGSSPRMNFTAKIEKSGVVTVLAQSGGVVQRVYTTEGKTIGKGEWIAWLSTNYSGGTIQSVSRQIAQKSYDFTVANYDTQKDMIAKRRSIADKIQGQTDNMRQITKDSIDDTKTLIGLNQELVRSLDSQIQYLESTNINATNSAEIMQAKSSKAGLLSALLSLQGALRNAEYQADSAHEPGELAKVQHDLTIQQLDLEEKSLDLNKEISELNLRVAQISESLMYPVSPVGGIVERVYVQPGQMVSPGMPIATIKGTVNSATAVVSVSKELAQNMSRIEKSKIMIKNRMIELTPKYISTEATNGSFHTAVFDIPSEYVPYVTQGAAAIIEVPVGTVESSSVIPFVPIDAVYQTQSRSYVYIANSSDEGAFIAKAREVTLGNVYGSYVEITNGLQKADQVIIDRNVIDGDSVSIQ